MSQSLPTERPVGSAGTARVARNPGNGLAELWSIPATRALVALGFVVLLGLVFNAHGAFFKIGTHRDALRQASVYGILACGLSLVVIRGGIVLAVGTVRAFVSVRF